MGRRRSCLVVVFLATTFAVTLFPARADQRWVRDSNDTPRRLDIRWVSHGHASDPSVLRHRVTMYADWRRWVLSPEGPGSMSLWFSTSGDSCAEAHVIVDVKDGRFRARIQSYNPLFCGRHDDSGGSGNLRLIPQRPRRPDARSLVVFVPADMLAEGGVDEYAWSATTYFYKEGTKCFQVCIDDVPDNGHERGRIVHRLTPLPL